MPQQTEPKDATQASKVAACYLVSTSSRAGVFVREKPLTILVAPSAALAALAPPSFRYLTACILVNGVLREGGASNLLAVEQLSFVLKRICIPDYAQHNVDQHT